VVRVSEKIGLFQVSVLDIGPREYNPLYDLVGGISALRLKLGMWATGSATCGSYSFSSRAVVSHKFKPLL